jgi:hypothetical protein
MSFKPKPAKHIVTASDANHIGKAKDLKTSSSQERINLKIDFGKFGELPLSFIVEKADLDLARHQVDNTGIGMYDVLREIGLEYIFAMRTYIEQIEPTMTYDRIEFVEIAGQKVGGAEFHRRLAIKTENLNKGDYKYEYGSMAKTNK